MIEKGQILYATTYKTRVKDFHTDLIIGLRLIKPKVIRITPKYFEVNTRGSIQKIKVEDIGKNIFLTEKECYNFILEETEDRYEKLREKFEENTEYQHFLAVGKELKKIRKKNDAFQNKSAEDIDGK